ncbi:MAG: response regulator transcription factor [Chloroflexota bacterium]
MAAMKSKVVRVAIVDSQPIFRLGMTHSIRESKDLKLCFSADNSSEILPRLKEESIDVLLLALRLPNPAAIELRQRMRAQFAEISVIYIVETVHDLHLAIAWGTYAAGVISREIEADKLIHAIQLAYVGLLYSPDELQRIQNWKQEIGERLSLLKQREWEVFWLVLEGYKNGKIAQKLGLTENTVEKHVSNLLSKLRLASKSSLISFVLQHHLLAIRHLQPVDFIRTGNITTN